MIGHVISMHRCSSGSMNLSCLQLRMRCRDKTFISLKILTLSIPYGCFRRFSVLSCWYFALQVTTGDSLVQVPWPTSTSLVLSVVFACSSAASYTSVSCTTAAVWTGYLGIIWWVFLYGQWNIGDWCCASWGVIQVSLRLFCGACDLSLRAFTRRLRAFTTCSATATFLWRYVSEFWKSNEFILCWLSDFGRNLLWALSISGVSNIRPTGQIRPVAWLDPARGMILWNKNCFVCLRSLSSYTSITVDYRFQLLATLT